MGANAIVNIVCLGIAGLGALFSLFLPSDKEEQPEQQSQTEMVSNQSTSTTTVNTYNINNSSSYNSGSSGTSSGVRMGAATTSSGDMFISAYESSHPISYDLANPQPGMIFKGYNLERQNRDALPGILDKSATVKSTIATTETFSWSQFSKNTAISQGVWEGFLKCTRSATCTILIKQDNWQGNGCILFVNGKKVCSGYGQQSVDVDMKAGFNHIKVIAQNKPVSIYLSPKGSTDDPKLLSPSMLYHDDIPEDDVI
ncbi:hypothetical protein IKW72_08645 [bacterium]|nr:hypothetical protein [bacterium]